MSRRVVDILNSMPEQNKFFRGLCSWTGFKSREFIYQRNRREYGTPAYTFKKLLVLARDGIIGFSTKPLRLATLLAILLGTISLLLIGWLLIGGVIGNSAPKGWTSLVIVILLCSSANLVVLGIIGEYIGQLLRQSKNRPTAIISEKNFK
jgi:dolichol-phosphate mannosyltransferase